MLLTFTIIYFLFYVAHCFFDLIKSLNSFFVSLRQPIVSNLFEMVSFNLPPYCIGVKSICRELK